MIGYDALKKLTEEDIAEIKKLWPIADEAEEAEELIKDTWLFRSGEEEVIVWKNDTGGVKESMNYDGIWIRNVEGIAYCIIKCDATTIFDYFYAEYVYKNRRPDAFKDANVVKMAEKCGYFREFLKRTKERHKAMSE